MTVTDMMCTQAGSGLLDALQPFVISSLHLSGRILGQGAYGVVLEAEIPGATCAVKKLHDVFLTGDAEWVDDQALEIYRTKFIRECKLLSSIRHPYIVQFLGVHFFPGSATPALVMEKLLTNLHGFLQPDTQHKPYIPVGLKISILHNVAQGLLFLQSHSPPIIHRDLSAKNVLLNIGMEAKIADLGVARLMPASKILMTKGPGNSIYLPPEAHGDAYDISIDLFSLGVLALFTFTLIFPDPLPATYTDVEGKVIGRTEIERRSVCMKELYEQLQNDHEIVSLIEKCLDNHPVQRPDIREIVQVLVTFKARCSDVHVAMNRLELLQVIERNGRETQDLTKQESQEREDTGNLGLDLSTGDSVSVKESETQLQLPTKESRAVAIIGSVVDLQQPVGRVLSAPFKHKPPETVPQSPAVLSDNDWQVLEKLGLPPEKWDTLHVLLATYNQSHIYDVFSVQVSKPGMELSRSYVLEQIEYLLMHSAKKNAVVIHYYGNGRRNTGDWCFKDGYITFRDIAALYMKQSLGQLLYLVPDCSSSGQWVVECAKFLDEQGVRPCGHSAKEKGILIKVFASCGTHQESSTLAYPIRAMGVDNDGLIYHWFCKMLSDQQTTFGVDFTLPRCGAQPGEKCVIGPDSSWASTKEIISDRTFLVHGTDHGKSVWSYILLYEDPDKIREFKLKTQRHKASSCTLELKDYGTVLKSGLGSEPPPHIKEHMEITYCL